VIKNEKVALDRQRVRRNVFLVFLSAAYKSARRLITTLLAYFHCSETSLNVCAKRSVCWQLLDYEFPLPVELGVFPCCQRLVVATRANAGWQAVYR